MAINVPKYLHSNRTSLVPDVSTLSALNFSPFDVMKIMMSLCNLSFQFLSVIGCKLESGG